MAFQPEICNGLHVPIDVGRNLGTATFVPVTNAPSPMAPQITPPLVVLTVPEYKPAAPTHGIVQHFDVHPPTPPHSAYFLDDAAATAIIEIPAAAKIENLRLVAQWGSGAGATPVPVNQLYYDVQLSAGPAPDLNAWSPSPSPSPLDTAPQVDPWLGLAPSVYLHLPAPPTSAKPFSFAVPTDGTPPPFDALLAAVQQTIAQDPGAAPVVATIGASAGGDLKVQLPAGTAGIAPGMSVTGAGVAVGTRVTAIDASGLATLNQELTGPVPAGTSLTFAPDLGALSADQCRNIAHEIVWSQQPPPPRFCSNGNASIARPSNSAA